MNGLSILLTSYNMRGGRVSYLKRCLDGLKKNSVLDNQLCIHLDGNEAGSDKWLLENKYGFSMEEWRGTYHGWNKASERADREFLVLLSDDMFCGPEWDKNIMNWARQGIVLVPRLVEPGVGSYPPPYDCGTTPENFDPQKFVSYAETISVHSLKPNTFGAFIMATERYKAIGGFDENLGPIGVGSIDLITVLKKKYPETRFFEAEDVILYHLQASTSIDIPDKPMLNERSVKRFVEKWGFGIEEAYGKLNAED